MAARSLCNSILAARLRSLVAFEQCSSALQPQRSWNHRQYASEAAPSEEAHSSSGSDSVKITVNPYKAHRVDPPAREVETSKEELTSMYHDMFMMRRMELAADMLYKQKLARGFLHLADGQEAVPVGMEAGASKQDSVVQSYRDHLNYVARGGKVQDVFAELLGRVDGPAEGKGGSMHLYSKQNNFYGGFAIVGEQCPIGAGVAFAHKYKKEPNVCFTIYGDGAANQGQLFEAFNMSALWRLPVVFVCENNHFGMGTSEQRAAFSHDYYKRGDYIPGLWVDGMDVLAVKNATQFAKKFAVENGPIILEMDTYRYHGHSISDPGQTYRTRDEIQGVRRARDPIEHVKVLLEEQGFYDKNEMKKMEKEWKKTVEEEVEAAKNSKEPPIEYLWQHTYVDGLGSQMRPIEIGLPKVQL